MWMHGKLLSVPGVASCARSGRLSVRRLRLRGTALCGVLVWHARGHVLPAAYLRRALCWPWAWSTRANRAPVASVSNGFARARLRPQFVKAGYAADNLPRFIFPSIVGRPVLRAEEEAIGDVELKVGAAVGERRLSLPPVRLQYVDALRGLRI